MHISMKPLILLHDGKEYDVSNLSMKHQMARVRLYPSPSTIPSHDIHPRQRHRFAEAHVNPSHLHLHHSQGPAHPDAESDAADATEDDEATGDTESDQLHLHTSRSVEFVQLPHDLRLPLRGSMDTILALKEHGVTRHECWSCRVVLGCIDTAQYIICPFCRCVMPTAVGDNSSRSQTLNHDHTTATSAIDDPCVGLGSCSNHHEVHTLQA
jgi:hypothetical protein